MPGIKDANIYGFSGLAAVQSHEQQGDRAGRHAAAGEVRVVIRPERIRLTSEGQVAGVVESSVFMGNSQDYRVRVGEYSLAVVDYSPGRGEVFREGDEVYVSFAANDLHIVGRGQG